MAITSENDFESAFNSWYNNAIASCHNELDWETIGRIWDGGISLLSVISIIRSLWPRKFVIGILAVLNAMLSSLPHKTSMIPHPENGIWQLLSPQALDNIRLTREGSNRNLSPPGPFRLSFSSRFNILEPSSMGTEPLIIRSLASVTQTLLVLNNVLPDSKENQGSFVNGPSRNVCASVLNCWENVIRIVVYGEQIDSDERLVIDLLQIVLAKFFRYRWPDIFPALHSRGLSNLARPWSIYFSSERIDSMDNGISHRSQTDARGPALARDRGALEEIAGGSSTHPPAGRIEAQTLTSHHHSRALRAAADNQARVNGPLVALFRQTAAKRKYHECVVSHTPCNACRKANVQCLKRKGRPLSMACNRCSLSKQACIPSFRDNNNHRIEPVHTRVPF